MTGAILATSPFLALAALACPIGMGAMMWFMARGGRSKKPLTPSEPQPTVDDLRREHQRLAVQIEDLEGTHNHTTTTGAVDQPAATAAGPRDTLAR